MPGGSKMDRPGDVEQSLDLQQRIVIHGRGQRLVRILERKTRNFRTNWRKYFLVLLLMTQLVPPHIPKAPAIVRINEKHAERFVAINNNNMEPCQDFHLFVSTNGSQTAGPDKKVIQSTIDLTKETMLETLKELLEDPNTNYESRTVMKAKQVYQDCMLFSTSASPQDRDLSWLPLSIQDKPLTNWSITKVLWGQSGHAFLERILAEMVAHSHEILFTLKPKYDNDLPYFLSFNTPELYKTPVSSSTNESSSAKLDEESVAKFEEDLQKLVETSKCEQDGGTDLSGNNGKAKFSLAFIQRQVPQVYTLRV